jgi:peptidoglycan/LPS O-acetylase OafA/YrhL
MSKQDHIAGLDVLRIVAAYLVFFNHLGQFNTHYDIAAHGTVAGAPLAFPFMAPFSGVGSVGVEIFFVISGFVITASAQNMSAMEFAWRRFLRVAPALWICSTLTLLARAATGESLPYLLGCWLRSVTLAPMGPSIDGVVWTLVVEAFFYALVFITLISGRLQLDTLAKIIGFSSVGFVTVLTIAQINIDHPTMAWLCGILNRFPFKVFLLRDGVFFAGGMVFWQWVNKKEIGLRGPLLMLLFLVFGALEIFISSEKSVSGALVTLAIWAAGLAWLACSVLYRARINDVLSSNGKLIANLGRLSYTLYLSHYALGMVLVSVFFTFQNSTIISFTMTIVVITTIAWTIMAGAERRLQSLMRTGAENLSPLAGRFRKKRPAGDIV